MKEADKSGKAVHQASRARAQAERSPATMDPRSAVGNLAVQDLARSAGTSTVSLVETARADRGTPLGNDVRSLLPHSFGDLSDVRIHTGQSADIAARALEAHAFTVGRELFFRKNAFNPRTVEGNRLIAHEAAHAVQQRAAGPGQAPALERHTGAEEDAHRAAITGSVPKVKLGSLQVFTQHEETTPQSIVDRYTSFWSGLDEVGLGQKLFELAWMSPDHYSFVIDVMDALDWSDRDDVAGVFVDSARDDNLEEFARTDAGRRMLRRLKTELLGGITTVHEQGQAVRIFGVLKRQEGAEEGGARAQAALDVAEKKALEKPPDVSGIERIDPSQIDDRLRLIDNMLRHIRTEGSKDDQKLEMALTFAEQGVKDLREGQRTDPNAVAAQVGLAQRVIERVDRSLGQLDFTLAQYRTSTEMGAAQPYYIEVVEHVRAGWVEALQAAFGEKSAEKLAVAESLAAALPRAFTEIDLGILAHSESGALVTSPSAEKMMDWAKWVRKRLDALEAEAQTLAEARRKNDPDFEAKAAKFRDHADLIQLSIEGIQDWETAIRAYEMLAAGANLIPGAYQDTATIRERCQKMKDAALAEDVVKLRTLLEAFRSDPAIQRFYKAIPLFIGMSAVLAGFAIMLIATVASMGVGALVAVPEGAAILAVTGEVALEALTFTAVSRTLQNAIGPPTHTPLLVDFAINFALFGLLRVTGSAIRGALAARGLQSLAGLATNAAGYGILEGWGVLHFRIEEGRWPTSDEIAIMSVENLVMLAAMAAIAPLRGAIVNQRQLATLRTFNERYGARVAAIENARNLLSSRVRTELMAGRGDDQTVLGPLRAEAKNIEQQLHDLIEQVRADREIGIHALRTALADATLQRADIGSRLLTASLDLPRQVGLQRAGGEAQYTYEFGSTSEVVQRLQAMGAKVTQATDAAGLHSLTAEVEGNPPMFFVERQQEFRERLRTIAQTIESPATTRAERNEVLRQIRTVHDQPPGELEGYVLESSLEENRRAISELEKVLLADKPDVIVGMQRGGAFLADVVGAGDPALTGRVRHMQVHTTADGQKFDVPAQQAEFEALINKGAHRIAVVDTYMGGTTASALRDVVLKVVRAHPDVQIDIHWLRESFGFETRTSTGGVLLQPPRGALSAGQPGASQISSTSQTVRIAVGDDMTMVYDPASHEPITIFNREGRVTNVFYPKPGQTTRELLIEMLNRRAGP